MISKGTIIFGTFLTVLSSYYLKNGTNIFNRSEKYPLIIGIISSRENFIKRQHIRETWLNISYDSYGYPFKSWFIIGSTGCPIPPQCRLDKYSCKKLSINESGISEYFQSSIKNINTQLPETQLHIFHPGFSFQVNHPVVINKLGIPIELLIVNKTISITLRDLQTKDIIIETFITLTNQMKSSENGYIYKDVESFLLPKGYEGLLIVEGYLYHGSYTFLDWNNGSGVISFKRIYTSQNDEESIEFSDKLQAAPSIAFQILDIDKLKIKISECNQLHLEEKNRIEQETKELIKESDKWNDIIFVDIIDTYRNLPRKLLLFYKWLTAHIIFNAVLKTDDDCIVDVATILLKLKDKSKFNPEKNWLWSRFRYGWPLNRVGKWADYDYKSPSYPMFPCGGGYVISQAAVQWLSNNMNHLYPYQGEDVSIGIWLAAINAQLIQDQNWECGSECTENSYNRAQLNSTEMQKSWIAKNKCKNICHCVETF